MTANFARATTSQARIASARRSITSLFGGLQLRNLAFLCLAGFSIIPWLAQAAAGADAEPRRFILNEKLIQGINTPSPSLACAPRDVLVDLFKQIGPVAKIYPTENYYYFTFYRDGKSYSGSLRLPVDSRDRGILQFACNETATRWLTRDDRSAVQAELSEVDGVIVRKIADLEYTVDVGGETVKFLLNKVDQTPDKGMLGPNEYFAGRSVDESGVTFDLIYNKPAKSFYYALARSDSPIETFVEVKHDVYLEKRTGFVFFADKAANRYILIAAHSEDIYENTWFDGPFDQLPENFYESIGFWNYVYDAFPELKGKLSAGGTNREMGVIFALMPYRGYVSKFGLKFVDSCLRNSRHQIDRILCLTRANH
ncbi:MAG TPA: hypothetical protein VII56_08450 [Rhizomicrobium sp.]